MWLKPQTHKSLIVSQLKLTAIDGHSLGFQSQLAIANRQKSIVKNSLGYQLQLALPNWQKSSLIQVL